MKTRLSISNIINILLTLIILTVIGFFAFMIMVRPGTANSYSTSYDVKKLPPLDSIIPNTLPHYKYEGLKDSIKNARNLKNGNFSIGISGNGMIGYTTQFRCDTCSFRSLFNRKNKAYFITFSDWKLDTTQNEAFMPTLYFIKNNQAYLRKSFCEKENKNKSGKNKNIILICQEKDIAIPFRVDNRSKSIMIQVSKPIYTFAAPVITGVQILFIIYFLYFVIGGFIKVLAEIASGTPFSDRNVKRLRFISLNLLVIPLGLFLINLLVIPLIFHSYFMSENIKLDAESWKSLWKPAVLYVIFTALYIAFKKGKQLKDDSDLTI